MRGGKKVPILFFLLKMKLKDGKYTIDKIDEGYEITVGAIS